MANVIDVLYTASSGNEYHLQTSGLRIRDANFHKWTYTPQGTRLQNAMQVSHFNSGALQYETTLYFNGAISARRTLINTLHDEWEADIRNQTPGRITWGDYYLDCYMIHSSNYPSEDRWGTLNEITIYAPHPFWRKEATYSFAGDQWFVYTKTIKLNPVRETPYIITLTGTADDSAAGYCNCITDDTTLYHYFYPDIDEGETLEINGLTRKITKTDTSGNESNYFHCRRPNDLWWAFPAAESAKISYKRCSVDITLFYERSEPLWT